jgi:peptidoglycan/LPS O-acetylase OafA/YrhL
VGCWVAIDLFFVLSGFLISGLFFQELKKTGDVSVSRFLVRRGFKIYPVFWLMLLTSVILRISMGEPFLKRLLVEFFFVQNYVVGPPPTYISSFWGITWSLGVEEHFYLMMAGLVYVLQKAFGSKWPVKIHSLPKLFLCVAIGCVLVRFITCLLVPYQANTKIWFLYATHARMDALFFGVLLSYYWHHRWDDAYKAKLMAWRWLFGIAGVALLIPAIYEDEEWFRIFGFVFTYIGSGYLMISLLSLDRKPAGICSRAMAWLGRHSYSVYLWHIMASTFVLPLITFKAHSMWAYTTNLFIYFVLCWSVGVVMSILVEFPMLHVRERYFPWLGSRPGITKPVKAAVQQGAAG